MTTSRTNDPSKSDATTSLQRWLPKVTAVNDNEVQSVVWSWIYVFLLFVSYDALRPIRNELAAAGGVHN
ncbi:hypothetical protein [Shewanella sp.]|uniref:hypothetical protein n=1 Tax=Shewanella sp. TaxID=50422 RepID=UPI003A970F71